MWEICTSFGYLLDFDVYCGKNSFWLDEKLKSCALGSRVVLQMIHELLISTGPRKLQNYHIYIFATFL